MALEDISEDPNRVAPSSPTPANGTSTTVKVLAALTGILLVAVVILIGQVRSLDERVDQIPTTQSGFDWDTYNHLQGVCRLLGALAAAQGVSVSPLFEGETMGTCEEQASQAASQQRQGS
jgi:hypothetical protein